VPVRTRVLNAADADVNECDDEADSTSRSRCDAGERCENTVGSFICRPGVHCGPGYRLNASTNTCHGQPRHSFSCAKFRRDSVYSMCRHRSQTNPRDALRPPSRHTIRYDTIRCDARCYFNVRSKADISQLDLPHVSVQCAITL